MARRLYVKIHPQGRISYFFSPQPHSLALTRARPYCLLVIGRLLPSSAALCFHWLTGNPAAPDLELNWSSVASFSVCGRGQLKVAGGQDKAFPITFHLQVNFPPESLAT